MSKTATGSDYDNLTDLIGSIKVAMLTSVDDGQLRSRPMVAAQQDFAGALFFFTRYESAKAGEVREHSQVNVSYAEPDKQIYVSLSGSAEIIRERAVIEAHWSEAMRTWFPQGKADPDIAILKVNVDQAEYWDAPSSAMVYLFGYVKAITTGKSPHPGENEKLHFA
jgi:general stress protein 26